MVCRGARCATSPHVTHTAYINAHGTTQTPNAAAVNTPANKLRFLYGDFRSIWFLFRKFQIRFVPTFPRQ